MTVSQPKFEKTYDHVIHSSKDTSNEVFKSEKNAIAGGIAGSIGKTLTAPLSRLTVLYQVSPIIESMKSGGSGGNIKGQAIVSDSLFVTFNNIIRYEGFFSLWKGNFTSVIHRFPYSAINFSSFEASKAILRPILSRNNVIVDENHDSSISRFICGAISGAISCISCYPLDIVRTRLTVGRDNIPVSSSISVASPTGMKPIGAEIGAIGGTSLTVSGVISNEGKLKSMGQKQSMSKIIGLMMEIVEKDGFFGLYRGLSASLAVAVPNLALSFTVYGKIKEKMIDYGAIFVDPRHPDHLSICGSLMSGSMSGMISAFTMFPVDVIRKRMQIMGAIVHEEVKSGVEKSQPRHGMLYHARNIYTTNGIRGFYRGIVPELLKVCPMVAITFSSYEIVKNYLDEKFP